MQTRETSPVLTRLFSELIDGANDRSGAFILNSGDVGLLRSLEKLPADEASRSVNDGATIAAHAQHVRYGLSLMNRWATEGGNPFADANVPVPPPSPARSRTGAFCSRSRSFGPRRTPYFAAMSSNGN